MDPILEASKHLIPDWMERLIEDCQNEASSWPVKLLGIATRRLVWNLCHALGIKSKGVPGQVCRLLERYFAAWTRSISRTITTTTDQWEEFKRSVLSRIPLLVASAIQLSGKMASISERVGAITVQKVLMMRGLSFSIAEITASEFEFLKMLEFRIPLWTSVEAAELLATEIGMDQQMLRGVIIIVDVAEFYRFKIEEELEISTAVHDTETISRQGGSKVRTLLLCAGAVLAAARHLNYQGPDPVQKLATLTRAPCAYLTCICDVILQHINDDDDEPNIKRSKS